MFPSISNLFRNTQQVQLTQPQGQPANNNPGQPQVQPTGKPGSTLDPNAGNGGQPGQGQPGQQQQTQNSPLDGFKDLWKTDPNANNANSDPFASPLFQTDPNKIREAAGKMDFLSQIPQEMLQKAMAGNDPQSFMQVMNAVAQNVLATSLQLGTATTEQAGSLMAKRFDAALPGRFKNFQLQSQAPTNPALSHPAVQPLLKSVREQISRQNPDLPAAEVTKMAEDYFSQMMTAVQQNDPNAPPKQTAAEDGSDFNWAQWASTSSPQNF